MSFENQFLSVIMPVFNAERYLKESIESILNQSFKSFEFICINDASTDKSSEILQSYAKKDSRIKVIEHQKNKGIAKSLNEGITLSNSNWIVRMDADDIAHPNRFEEQVSFLKKHPTVDIFGTHIQFFGDKHTVNRFPTQHDELMLALLFGCPFAHPTIFMKKQTLLDHHLSYNPKVACAQDYELWAKAAPYVKFANVPLILLRYRTHSQCVSARLSSKQAAIATNTQHIMMTLFGIEDADYRSEYIRILQTESFDRQLDDIKLMARCFSDIIQNNNYAKYIDPLVCQRVLANHFFKACFALTRFGWKARQLYFASSLSNYVVLNSFKRLEFWLRSFFRIKR